MDRIHAPYNFVPLSPVILEPDWAVSATPDLPYDDGICGTLEVEIRAETPIFTRHSGGAREEVQRFFRLPDGRLALPSTTVKGAVRSVVEVASFGRMWRVNDETYGVRDLHNNELYVQHMAGIQRSLKGKNEPLPKVGAAWLRIEGNRRILSPVSFAKIEYRALMALADDRGASRFTPGNRQSSVDKYRSWGEASRQVRVDVDWLRDPVPDGGAFGRFGKVSRVAPDATHGGTLVFTGQPAPWRPEDNNHRPGGGRPKHHDFVFLDTAGPPLEVTSEAWKAFEFVHSEGREQHAEVDTPNREWGFWLEQIRQKRDVPVFYLMERGRLRAFGLAMMFRLAYRYSVGEAVRNTQPGPRDADSPPRPDLAQTIFGWVPLDHAQRDAVAKERGEHGGLRGRVAFDHFALERGNEASAPVAVVLGSPKASYYPNYVEQDPGAGEGAAVRRNAGKPSYATYMDKGVRVRGWKRYQPKPEVLVPPPPATSTGKAAVSVHVGTRFLPVASDAVFAGRIRAHNLRPMELGAILWALDFGGEQGARHMIGMGRPLGYGRVKIAVRSHDLKAVATSEAIDLDTCRRAFEAWAEDGCARAGVPGGWRSSRQIHELLAIATPVTRGELGRSMRLDHPQDRNEFVTAKVLGLHLLPAGAATWKKPAGGPAPTVFGTAGAIQPVADGPRADALIAEIRALKVHQIGGRFNDLVERARKLHQTDRKRVADALVDQIDKIWKDGRKRPLFKEVDGWR